MTVTFYYEIDPLTLNEIMQDGIKRESDGIKSDNEKQKVDAFLDTHLPDWTYDQHIRRSKVVYAYLPTGDDAVIDIQSGEAVPIAEFMERSGHMLVKVKANEDYCWVSDLDMYDTLQRSLELDEMDSTREHLADRYWERVVPLTEYEPGSIKRPEVMIASSIRPEDIEVVKK